jgi:hypothetical protein
MTIDALDAWLASVNSRGVALRATGTKVHVMPKQAYHGVLTDDDRATLKDYRLSIVALLNEQHHGIAHATSSLSSSIPGILENSSLRRSPLSTALDQNVVFTDSESESVLTGVETPPRARCPFCLRAPCVGHTSGVLRPAP